MNKKALFTSIVYEGAKLRYGSRLGNRLKLKIIWELKHIVEANYIDYYLMVFWIFRQQIPIKNIGYWARGAVPSSIVCYCLGLSEVDPIAFDLCSARFVNDTPPRFQFDIEASRFEEFTTEVEDILRQNAKDFDIVPIQESLMADLTPMDYLSHKSNKEPPKELEEEIANYALTFPNTLDLLESYHQRKREGYRSSTTPLSLILEPTFGLLIYQEQMLAILRKVFHVSYIEANNIRRCIQRGDVEKIETYKTQVFSRPNANTPLPLLEESWECLTSNPNAFLKAHAVSRVLARYRYGG